MQWIVAQIAVYLESYKPPLKVENGVDILRPLKVTPCESKGLSFWDSSGIAGNFSSAASS